jgi:hypothetical protein
VENIDHDSKCGENVSRAFSDRWERVCHPDCPYYSPVDPRMVKP